MTRFLVHLSLVLVVGMASAARADTLQITSGQFVFGDSNPNLPASNLIGPDINVLVGGGNIRPNSIGCTPGLRCGLIGLYNSGSGFNLRSPLVIFGETVLNPGTGLGGAFALAPTVSSFTGPTLDAGFIYTAPFTAVGRIVVDLPGRPFSAFDFAGSGTVVATFVTITNSPDYSLNSAVYTFGPVAPSATVTTVPEPASMTLLGTGLAGGVGAVVRKRRSRQ